MITKFSPETTHTRGQSTVLAIATLSLQNYRSTEKSTSKEKAKLRLSSHAKPEEICHQQNFRGKKRQLNNREKLLMHEEN